MTYDPSIPQSTDYISANQPELLANFTQLNTQYGADHDGFNTGSGNGSGMHDQVTFLANQSAPSLTRNSVAGVSGLYCNTDGTNSQLFFQNAVGSFQLTGVTATASGSVFVGGVIIKWGTGATAGAATFPVAFPNNCFSMVVSSSNSSYTGSLTVTSLSKTGYNILRTSGSGSTGFYYVAIGN